jgi:hypothetical protein
MNRFNFRPVFVVAGFAVVATMFFMAAPPFTTVDSQSNFTVEYDTDRRFGDYKHFDLTQASHEVCRDHCAADPNCKAYTYTKPWQQNPAHCWLKNTVPNGESGLSCCISGVKGGASGGGGGGSDWGATNMGAGLNGKTLRFYGATTPERCQADCTKDGSCRGFTFMRAGAHSPNDPAMCYLMSEATSFAPSPCCISAIKGSRGSGGGGGGGGGNTGGLFGGTWDLYAWDVMTLEQNGNSVTGRYSGLGSGTLQGTVNGNKLYFSFRNSSGGVGSAVMTLMDANARRYSLNYCDGAGCDPMKQGYVEGTRRR